MGGITDAKPDKLLDIYCYNDERSRVGTATAEALLGSLAGN